MPPEAISGSSSASMALPPRSPWRRCRQPVLEDVAVAACPDLTGLRELAIEQSGIAKERLSAVSFADSRPREGNDSPEGRTKNRRIEIKLVPVYDQQTAGPAEGTKN